MRLRYRFDARPFSLTVKNKRCSHPDDLATASDRPGNEALPLTRTLISESLQVYFMTGGRHLFIVGLTVQCKSQIPLKYLFCWSLRHLL